MYWPGEDDWFNGTVKVVDGQGRSCVNYDDGQVEMLHFAMERFKLLNNAPASGISSLAACITSIIHGILFVSCELRNWSVVST